MRLSVRARLTAWNGGVFILVFLGLAIGGYVMLRNAMTEQSDQAVRQQWRSAALAIDAYQADHSGEPVSLTTISRDLTAHGLAVQISENERSITTRPLRSEHAEAELRAESRGAHDQLTGHALAVAAAIKEHARTSTRERPFTVSGPAGGTRVYVDRTMIGNREFRLAATERLDEVDEILTEVQRALFITIPLVALLAIGIGYLLARRALAPVAAMTAQAQSIGGGNLHERLRAKNPRDELGKLANTFNEVLDRADRALVQQSHFTADASHELRTPVAIIRSEADVALGAGDRSNEEYRNSLAVIREGSEQLSKLVNDMFLLARADAGQGVRRAPIYLDDLIAETVRSMRSIAATRNMEINISAPVEVSYSGDEELLRRLLINLLDNAIKYAPSDTTIHVKLWKTESACHLFVANTGPGIPAESRPFIFDRFYRADASRRSDESKHGSGAGLGLSIAREIAELHGGRLTLVDPATTYQSSTVFELCLPVIPESRQ